MLVLAAVPRFTNGYVLTCPIVCDLALLSTLMCVLLIRKTSPSHTSMTLLFQGEDQNTSWKPSARHWQHQTTNNGSWLHRLKSCVIKCESGNLPALEWLQCNHNLVSLPQMSSRFLYFWPERGLNTVVLDWDPGPFMNPLWGPLWWKTSFHSWLCCYFYSKAIVLSGGNREASQQQRQQKYIKSLQCSR